MRTTTLGMLGALMCVLAAWAEVTPVTNFNLQRMAGKWYIVGVATNAEWFVTRKAQMKVGTAVLVPTEEGNLDLSFAALMPNGNCWRLNQLPKKTDTPGRFTYGSQKRNNDIDMRIVEVLYDDYALVYTNKTKDGVSEVVNNLYSRTPEASVAWQQRFTQFSLDTGILPENIVILPKHAECPED